MSRIAIILTVAFILGATLLWMLSQNIAPTPVVGKKNQNSELDTETVQLINKDELPVVEPKRKYKLGILFPFLAAPFWVNESFGVLDQAEKMGIDVVWFSADGYTNIDRQTSQLEDLISLKVDAIVLGATSFNGMVPAVNRAIAKGIPVITHVTTVNSKKISGAVLTDDVAIGRKQAEFMGKALGGQGNIVMFNGPAAADWSTNRTKGFKEILSEKYPAIKILAERNGIPDRADSQRIAEDFLVTFPKIDGFFTVADGMAMGVADAVRAAGRIDNTIVTTASFSKETIPYIMEKWIDVNVDESPVFLGRLSVIRAVQLLNGEDIPKKTYVPIPEWTDSNISSVSENSQWAPENWSPNDNNK